MKQIFRALTIAGSDSGGGAGIQADLKTFAALGVHGMAAVTALTAQNTVTVAAIQDVDPGVVRAQIEAVVEDIGVDAAKTGMLHTQEIIEIVADQIARYRIPTVVDPVMVAKGGARLLEETAAETLIHQLLPLATVVTPNATEAAAIEGQPIHNLEDAKAAARAIGDLGPQAVVVKGGHLPGAKAIDVLWYEGRIRCFEAERMDSTATHGTGCTFSAAIAAELAKGTGIVDAISVAKAFMTRAIRFGLPIGHGHGPVNPMANLYHEAAKARVLALVKDAVNRLETCPHMSSLIPESQTNIVMATPQAMDPRDVAGVRGRIVRVGGRVKASACPEFGASSHVARTVLVAMHHDPTIQAAMNIRYSKDLIAVCRRLGFAVSSYDRREEPPEIKEREGMTTQWGAEQAITALGCVPQVIYHTGDWGKEPMIILLGQTAPAVAEMAVTIAGESQGSSTA